MLARADRRCDSDGRIHSPRIGILRLSRRSREKSGISSGPFSFSNVPLAKNRTTSAPPETWRLFRFRLPSAIGDNPVVWSRFADVRLSLTHAAFGRIPADVVMRVQRIGFANSSAVQPVPTQWPQFA